MREKLHRAGWLFMVILFVLTSVGVGIYAFWENTHSSSSTQSTALCNFTQVPTETLAVPDVYKPSGTLSKLESLDIETGSGAEAKAGDCVTAKYYGTLASDGTVFDEDFTKPLAIKFPLGQGQVIPGWDIGLLGMKVGGIRRLAIPAAQAYGDQATGSIPAKSDLVFVVKLEALN